MKIISWVRSAAGAILLFGMLNAFAAEDAWTTSAVKAANGGGKPRVLLIHDMEGLAGQDDPYTILYGHPQYALGQRLLVADVNAVIEGLFAGGAASVVVADGHGSGNPDSDIPVELLDARAKLISRPQPFDTYLDLATTGDFDAVVVVGMHAKSGSSGFISHTYTIGMQLLIGGRSITETELVGLLYGRAGIPVIFASGDDRLAIDLQTMPWLKYVTTKKATSAATAELFPVAAVHAEMRKQASLAAKHWTAAKIMNVRSPVQVTVRAVPPANMKWLKGMPGVQYENEQVSFNAVDMVAAYQGAATIAEALGPSFSDAELSFFNAQPDAGQQRQKGMEELYRRWFEAESGKALVPSASANVEGTYHGFN
jgi:D-amino peptidase